MPAPLKEQGSDRSCGQPESIAMLAAATADTFEKSEHCVVSSFAGHARKPEEVSVARQRVKVEEEVQAEVVAATASAAYNKAGSAPINN